MTTPSTLAPVPLAELALRLASLGVELIGDGSRLVTGITEDSRRVGPGMLFVARRGARVDGTRFIADALAQGAAGVVVEPGLGIEAEPRLETSQIGRVWGTVAQDLAGSPSRRMKVVGITGTNGKTTTTGLVVQALDHLGVKTARLGTLGFFIGNEAVFDTLTTPQPDELARALSEAVARDVEVCVMEVSSHALDQGRVAGVRFEVAAFTNLSQDHLDYHGSMDVYGDAKARLFREYAPVHRVLHVGDAFGARLAGEFPDALGVSTRADGGAISVGSLELSARGIRAEIRAHGESVWLDSALVGLHNLENLLVALGILTSLGYRVEPSIRALEHAASVPGRLERVDGPDDDLVALVDYAHTPDALTRALAAIRSVSSEPIVCVFGCGGDRDRKKREPMGRAVAGAADVVWLTSDNPRTEAPQRILDDVKPGLVDARGVVFEEIDRARAIRSAVLEAPGGATILVAGKGHENYQIIGTEVLPFDDVIEVRRALEERRRARQEPR